MLFISSGADDLKSNISINNDPEYVVRHYSDMIYGIALSHTGKKEDAEDILQETFLIYYHKRKTFTNENHRKAWLIKVALNCCKRALTRRRKHEYTPIDLVNVPIQFEHKEDSDVYSAILALPNSLKSVIYLYYFENMSAKEIGKILNIRESAVFMRLSRGRALLKDMLKGEYNL